MALGTFIVLTFLLFQLFGGNVFAQPTSSSGTEGGRAAGSYTLDNFDNVNLFNGNMNFKMPLLSVKGRGEAGVTVPLSLEMNWKLITGFIGQSPAYSYIQDGMSGAMQEGPGKLSVQIIGSSFAEMSCGGGPDWEPQFAKLKINFRGSDGTSYAFRSTKNNGAPYPVTTCPSGFDLYNHEREFITWDGAAVKFISDADIKSMIYYSAVDPSGFILLPNGTKYRIDYGFVTWIQDRNGNRSLFTYNGNGGLETITDSIGRVVTFAYDQNQSPYGFHTKITYKGFGGAERIVRISYKGLPDALRSGTTDFTTIAVVSDLWMPDGRKYNFLYSPYGYLARINLPTGGAYEYDYNVLNPPLVTQFINNGPPHIRLSERRVYSDGTNLSQKITYDIAEYYTYSITTVDTYNGSGTRLSRDAHYFHGTPAPLNMDGSDVFEDEDAFDKGREFITVFYAADGTTMMRKVETTWEVGRSSLWNPYGTGNTIMNRDTRVNSVTTTLSDTNYVCRTIYSYDPNTAYNLQTDVHEYDYGTGTPGNFVRRSHTEYEKGSNYTGNAVYILTLPTEAWTSSDTNGSQIVARTRYEYDNYSSDSTHAPLVNRSNMIGRDSTYGTSYTTRGNLTATTNYANAQNQSGAVGGYAQYDIAGNIVKAIDSNGNASTSSFNDKFGSPDGEAQNNTAPSTLNGQQTFAFATSVTNPAGYNVYSQYDYYSSAEVDSEDINGNINTAFFNDALGRPTQGITLNNRPALKGQSTLTYDDANRKITLTIDSKTYGDNLKKIESFYDGLGRTIETRRYELGSNYVVTLQQYDSMGRAYRSSNAYRPYLNEQPEWTETKFDDLGRVIEVKTPDNAKVTRTYSGNSVRVYAQALRSRAGITDALGRTTKVIEYDQSVQLESNYTYDVLGRLRKTAQTEGQTTQNRYFMYDDLGRIIRIKQAEQTANSNLNITDPVTGNTSWSVKYDYDNNSNVVSTTDSRNKTTTGTYDSLNRLTFKNFLDSTPDVTYIFDDSNIANSRGQLTAVTSSVSASYNTAFDELGRVKASRQVTDGQTFDFEQYTYDLSGALISQKYPSGRIVRNETDAVGRLTKFTSQILNQVEKVFLSSLSYNSTGAFTSARLGNGRWESAVFDSKRLQTKQVNLGGSSGNASILKLEYDFGTTDNNGSLRQQKVTVPGAAYQIIQNYTYDQLNRLKSAAELVNGNQQWKQTFTYDRFGNRRFDAANTTTLPANNGIYNPQIDAQTNKFLVAEGYNYDSEGNLTANPESQLFTYDAENHQTQVQNTSTQVTATYYYDGEGKRVRKTVGTEDTVFAYDALGKLAAEYSNTTDSRPKATNYITADELGSPRIVTNQLGQVISRHDYMPFGEELAAGIGGRTTAQGYGGADGVRKKFTGYERDTESGLDFAQNRYFSSKHGRFTSADPLTSSASIKHPQTLNRFNYAMNSPYKFTDPIGLASCGVSGAPGSPPGKTCTPTDDLFQEEFNKAIARYIFQRLSQGYLDTLGDATGSMLTLTRTRISMPAEQAAGSGAAGALGYGLGDSSTSGPAPDPTPPVKRDFPESGGNVPPPPPKPSFLDLWKAHPSFGNNVEIVIQTLDSNGQLLYKNQCAIRLSQALFKFYRKEFEAAFKGERAASGEALRAGDLSKWLPKIFGQPRTLTGNNRLEQVSGRRGIIYLEQFRGTTQTDREFNHIDLWNDGRFGHGDYLWIDRAKKVLFWELK
jgi:RHS repeat-associated protein